MEKPQQPQTRQIAYKTRIKEILEGEYIKEEGWTPNYVLSGSKKLSRINLVGIIVAKSDVIENMEFLLEDKGGKIPVRFFEKNKSFEDLCVGDFVLIVGRPREYSGQKYIVPEIVKKVAKGWFELRMFELGSAQITKQTKNNEKELEEELEENTLKKTRDVVEEKKLMENIIKSKINSEDVIGFIQKLDNGGGADYEEVLECAKDDKILKNLLEEGVIFEIRPGKLKVL